MAQIVLPEPVVDPCFLPLSWSVSEEISDLDPEMEENTAAEQQDEQVELY